MDNAVAVVQAYVCVNGYLAVTEYPGHVLDHLRGYVRAQRSRLSASESKYPGLSFLMTLEKAERGLRGHDATLNSFHPQGVLT